MQEKGQKDILQIQKIQDKAENGECGDSVERLRRGTRSLIPGEEDAPSAKKRRTSESEESETLKSADGDVINNTKGFKNTWGQVEHLESFIILCSNFVILATLAAALVWLALQTVKANTKPRHFQENRAHLFSIVRS